MRTRHTALLVSLLLIVATILAYLRDPAWLIRTDSGFRPWETGTDGTRYRWTGGHASFFVRSGAREIGVPIRTTFATSSDGPVTVTLSIDDRPAERLLLADDGWQRLTLPLPPPGSRHVRRIDIQVNRTRPGNRGVQVGDVQAR